MQISLPPYRVDAMHSTIAAAPPWHVTDYGIDAAHPKTTGKGVVVGIVDTGLDKIHAAGMFKDALIEAKDFTGSPKGWFDAHGHGSHCASIVLSCAPGVRFVIAKGLGDSGGGSDTGIAAAVRWCRDRGANIISMSLGSPQMSPTIEAACAEVAKTCLIFAATGNEGGRVGWPGASQHVVGVGAIDRSKRKANFSNYGEPCETVAPGVKIMGAYRNGGYAELSGTSMATPWAAGCAALRIELEKSLTTTKQMLALLPKVCDDLGERDRDHMTGWGVFNIPKLIAVGNPAQPGTDCLDLALRLIDSFSPEQKALLDQLTVRARAATKP